MKISLKWLNDFVDVKDFFQKPEALAEVLTKAGLEVEEIENKARDFDSVLTGLILEKEKHPNADKLSLCRVTTGEGVVHQIICGAQNHKANDKVVVALPGAILPGNFAIQKAVVRGIESGGMLCSLKELGLAKESQGIEILPEDAPIGKSYAEYKGFDDVTFELKVTANRADCLSHYGLAREVACLLGRELKKIESAPLLRKESASQAIALEVRASDLAPRYSGRLIQAVKVGASPEWLRKRLETVGLNSINNVVDVTNYVMMELGQPLHAFDASQIKGQKIIVDRAAQGEKFTTLDGTELTLTGSELMIKDGERGVCIAGVIGGKNSGVSEITTSVFLESAYFSPMSARKSLRSHGLNTDSGYRFARGVDPEGTMLALNRATELILKVAGGEAFDEAQDVYPTRMKKEAVVLSIQTISDRLGYAADPRKFEDYMRRLGCETEKLADGQYRVLPPSYRFDLEQDMDLVEEYARLNGYDQIPETVPAFRAPPSAHDAQYVLQRKASEALRAQGFSQSLHLVFVDSKQQKEFLQNRETMEAAGLPTGEEAVRILNPLNEEQDVMRQTLSYGLFKNMAQNFHQGNEYGRLFEIGKVFAQEGPEKYQETWRLGLSAWGQVQGLWQKENHPVVFELKAAIESLLRHFQVKSFQWLQISNKGEVPAFIHRGQAAHLMMEGRKVGFIGTLHPLRMDDEKIRVPAALAELDLDAIFKTQPRHAKSESFSRFPSAQRDLALVMPKVLKVGDVAKEIRQEAGPSLVHLQVFDVYEGDKLELGQKSVAFRLIYQDKKDTLRDEIVNDSIEKVLNHLKAKFQISVR